MMMPKFKPLHWIPLFLLSGTAAMGATPKLVAPNAFCQDAKALMKASEGCQDNGSFTAAAKACLGKIDTEAKKIGIDIAALKRMGAKNQQGDMKKAAKEYFLLTRKLDYIIRASEIARVETYNYIEHLYRPEDESDDEKENLAIPCFGSNISALESIAGQMDKKQMEFEAALDLTIKLLMETQKNAKNMDALGSTQQPIEGDGGVNKAAPAPSGPKGKNWNASDISGTEKKKEKPKK